jgi:hypothetical protein
MKKYAVKTRFAFTGTFFINAENKEEALERVEKDCGLVTGGGIHSYLNGCSYERPYFYENYYRSKRNAAMELRRKAKRLIREYSDECERAEFTVSLAGEVIFTGEVPVLGLRHLWKNCFTLQDYGFSELAGVRIC